MWLIAKRDGMAQSDQVASRPQHVRIVQSKHRTSLQGEVIRISGAIKNGKAPSLAVTGILSEELARSFHAPTESEPNEQHSNHVCSLAHKLDGEALRT